MKTNTQKNLDLAFAAFVFLLTFLYAPLGVHVYAGEVWNVVLNGLKSMDCIKFYAFVSHTAAIGVSVKYCLENVFNDCHFTRARSDARRVNLAQMGCHGHCMDAL